MKITQDVREFAKEQNIAEEKALAVGMAEKAKEFVATGSEIYHWNLAEGANPLVSESSHQNRRSD